MFLVYFNIFGTNYTRFWPKCNLSGVYVCLFLQKILQKIIFGSKCPNKEIGPQTHQQIFEQMRRINMVLTSYKLLLYRFYKKYSKK